MFVITWSTWWSNSLGGDVNRSLTQQLNGSRCATFEAGVEQRLKRLLVARLHSGTSELKSPTMIVRSGLPGR